MTFRGAVLDLDGTIYRGRERLPGARAAVEALRERDSTPLFFSNNPTEPPEAYARRLREMKIDVRSTEIVSAGSVTAAYLAREHRSDRIMVVGSPGLCDQLEARGLSLTDEWEKANVLLASYDRGFDYDRLTEALWAIENGATFVSTDPDMTVPHPSGRVVPGSGAVAHAIAGVVGRDPDAVCGKPSEEAIAAVTTTLGVPPEECLLVGDRLDTDIALGARCGMTTALVLTGVTDESDLDNADPTPDHVLRSIGDLDALL